MDSDETPRPWFPVKRYGYGWGLPNVWQGWAVLGAWIAGVAVGAIGILGSLGPVEPRPWLALGVFYTFLAVMIGVLTWICLAKGERPLRWRWGDVSDVWPPRDGGGKPDDR